MPAAGVAQAAYLEALHEVGGSAALADIAEHFGEAEGTARRKLDGLVRQGKLVVHPGRLRTYEVVRDGD